MWSGRSICRSIVQCDERARACAAPLSIYGNGPNRQSNLNIGICLRTLRKYYNYHLQAKLPTRAIDPENDLAWESTLEGNHFDSDDSNVNMFLKVTTLWFAPFQMISATFVVDA
jgi:hypothetical protein